MVLSSLLYHASVHVNSRSPSTLFHYGETVSQLALRLENPIEAASDDTIATVGLLAATGVSLEPSSLYSIGTLTAFEL